MNIGGDFFFKSRPFCWIKFKLNQNVKMGPLVPLLMYMVFGLLNSATECIPRSPFSPVERGAEAGPGGLKSVEEGKKLSRIGR
jgi:hypothetical protein